MTVKEKKYVLVLSVIISLFFMWGLITVLNDILVPHLKALFRLNYVKAMLIQFCFFLAYGIISMPSGKIIDYFGYKKGIIIALLISSIGCWIFLPAAGLSSYSLFLLGLFILASGIVLLQVAANPYIALLGKQSTASSRLNLAQAFNSLGTTIGPQIGSLLILATLTKADQAIRGINILYSALAILLLLIAIIIALFRLPKIQGAQQNDLQKTPPHLATIGKLHETPVAIDHKLKLWHFTHLILGSIAIFCYVGAEVSIGSFLVNFLEQPNILNLSSVDAGRHVSYYWGGAMVGRFIGFALLLKVRPRKALAFNAAVAILLVLTTLISQGPLAGYTVLSIGLFNSIMFPTIFTLAITGLDTFTPDGSGLLCTAIVGGAIIPVIQGFVADHIGIHHAFIIPLVCYVYILAYGLKGAGARCRLPKHFLHHE